MRTRRKKASGESKPAAQDLDLKDLEDIIERSGSGSLSDADRTKLLLSVETLAWLQQELANKTVTIAQLRSLFGMNTSEKMKDVLGDESGGKPKDGDGGKKEPGKPKKKPKGHGRKAASDYQGAERIDVPHGSLESGDPCPECPTNKQGKVYTLSKPSTLVRVIGQAPLQATVYELEKLRCNLCGTVFVAEPPPGVGDKKYDATAASMIGLLKYGSGMPFNRLERLQGNLRIPLPATTQWDIVNEAAKELAPVHEELIRQAAQGRLLHNDDTSMRVLALRKQIVQEQESGNSESNRTGIFLSNIVAEIDAGQRIALFFTGRQHAGENMADVLGKRAAQLDPPLQMCDGLDRNLPKDFATLLGNCLAHGRRKFVAVVGSFPDECRTVLETLRDVYRHDAVARQQNMSDAERLAYHQEHSGPLMDELECWMHQQIDEKFVEPNSALGKAITYMIKRWQRLTLFLRAPGAPLDNNVSERALKMAIRHRKNSLFYKTERGAAVGDIFMSLIHSAELAGANPLDYLTALLKNSAAVRRDPERWLPWSYAATDRAPEAITSATR